jgi:Pectate lyase superfamily protein
MTDFPDVKLKALVSFPAAVNSGAGVDVVKQNGSYQFNLDFGDFAPPVAGLADPAHQNALLWNNTTGQYALVPASALTGGGVTPAAAVPLIESGTGAVGVALKYAREDHVHPAAGGLADAASDGFAYGRRNAAWVKVRRNDVCNVRDYGAVADGVTDDAPAFRAALAATPNGGTLYIPSGIYFLNSAANNAVLDFTPFPNKGVTIRGDGWCHAGASTPLQGSALILGGNITGAIDFYHQAPTGYVFGGTAFKDFGVSTIGGVYTANAGRHGLHFDGTAATNAYWEEIQVENIFIDNTGTGYSIYSNGAGNAQGVMGNAHFRNCKLMQINAPNWGDANTISNCVFGTQAIQDSRNTGIYFYNVAGATSIRIANNFFVNNHGCIIDDGSNKAFYDNNDCENALTNTLGYLLYLKGSQAPVDTPTITNNRISNIAGSGTTYTPIYLDNVVSGYVAGNRLGAPTGAAANYPFVVMTANAKNTLIEANNTAYIGSAPATFNITDNGVATTIRTPLFTVYAESSGPSAPAAGRSVVWFDSTDKRLHDVDPSGAFGTTVKPSTAPAHQFARGIGVDGAVAYAQPALTDITGPSWQTFTPVIGASTGTPVASATGAYFQVGKILWFSMDITITGLGTSASGAVVTASLPPGLTAARKTCALGREWAVTGFMLNASISAGASILNISKYDNSTGAVVVGWELVISGCIEVA